MGACEKEYISLNEKNSVISKVKDNLISMIQDCADCDCYVGIDTDDATIDELVKIYNEERIEDD